MVAGRVFQPWLRRLGCRETRDFISYLTESGIVSKWSVKNQDIDERELSSFGDLLIQYDLALSLKRFKRIGCKQQLQFHVSYLL